MIGTNFSFWLAPSLRPASMRSFRVVGSSSLRPRAVSGAFADLESPQTRLRVSKNL